jgi:glycine C-acetyltransferase/8-amino-7-oxononanoate synthase
MGTLSKAVGSYGAFICGTGLLIDYLINKMRTGIFSTALSPVQNFISLENLKIMQNESFRRISVLEKAEFVAKEIKKIGYKINFYGTPILSLILGDEKKVLKVRDKLLKEGIFIQAIRPPTVPEGKSRLRITISFTHSEKDIILLLNIFKKLKKEV